jgi:general secretion pathway protein M
VIRDLNERQQRMLALAILALMAVVIISITVLPVWSANRNYNHTIATLEGRLEQLQRAAAIGASLQPRYQQLKQLLASDQHYLKSSSEALATAELQQLVKEIALAKKAEVLSMQNLPAGKQNDDRRVAIKVRMRGDLENIIQMFHALETGSPFLFLDKVSIRNIMGRRKTIPGNLPLDADFEIFGYLAPES